MKTQLDFSVDNTVDAILNDLSVETLNEIAATYTTEFSWIGWEISGDTIATYMVSN